MAYIFNSGSITGYNNKKSLKIVSQSPVPRPITVYLFGKKVNCGPLHGMTKSFKYSHLPAPNKNSIIFGKISAYNSKQIN